MKVWEATIIVCRRTDNEGVMWGDEYLLHEIAEELGWEHNTWHTSARVLRALSKTPGKLIKRKTLCGCHWVLMFDLPKESNPNGIQYV